MKHIIFVTISLMLISACTKKTTTQSSEAPSGVTAPLEPVPGPAPTPQEENPSVTPSPTPAAETSQSTETVPDL